MSKLGGKRLTAELSRLGAEIHDMLPDGTPVTRDEQLAKLIWQKALGWVEETRDAEGNRKKKAHPPESWAMQYIWERREGKAPAALPDESGGKTAAQKVRELATQRLNSIARSSVGSTPPPPPPFKGKGVADA